MTALLDRFAGIVSEPEETRVTKSPSLTSPRGVPWWAGVPGLDPVIEAGDWAFAAQCTAMACAACVFGADAGYPGKLLSRKGAPAWQWLDWLLDATSAEDAFRRRLALRLICERTQVADADDILKDAQHLHESCSARGR
jgi:hypothetical protein